MKLVEITVSYGKRRPFIAWHPIHTGDFTTHPTFKDAMQYAISLVDDLRLCSSCGERLRRSEGTGPCSDCHDAQCREHDKKEAPATAS